MSKYPTWSGLVYGNPGTRKTFFAASLPKPMKVFMFDPPAKGLAYQLQGVAGKRREGEAGGAVQYVTHPETKELRVELEYFHDPHPARIGASKECCAYEQFQQSFAAHVDEGWMTAEKEPRPYASVVLDSYTFLEAACLRMQQFKVNPAPGGVQDSKHNQMQWAGGARGVLLTDIVSAWPWIPCHSLILAHVDEKRYDEQEKALFGVSAIGSLTSILPAAFAEVYLMFVRFDDKEKRAKSWLLTESDGAYKAQTHIGAPNPCEAQWEALWRA